MIIFNFFYFIFFLKCFNDCVYSLQDSAFSILKLNGCSAWVSILVRLLGFTQEFSLLVFVYFFVYFFYSFFDFLNFFSLVILISLSSYHGNRGGNSLFLFLGRGISQSYSCSSGIDLVKSLYFCWFGSP